MYSRYFYSRASSIALFSVFLGACGAANGLDMIAADISKSDVGNVSADANLTIEDADDKRANETAVTAETPARILAVSELPDAEPEIPVNAYVDPKKPPMLASTSFETSGAVSGVAANSPELHALISLYSTRYGVPESLVHRVVKRESNYDPTARNKIYWGLMQIRHDTAQTMGYRGPASGLLDAETNLKYAVKYLRGAYLTASRNEDQAVRFYARGYYYDAKRKGLLKVTGLRP